MSEENRKRYDLEDRTLAFARAVRLLVKTLPKTIGNSEDAKQLVRASGSIGANYIEANEALGKKDFIMKIRTCRREAKECGYWLKLVEAERSGAAEIDRLTAEALEPMKIFGAIMRKCEEH